MKCPHCGNDVKKHGCREYLSKKTGQKGFACYGLLAGIFSSPKKKAGA
jgi:hypothetical protein